MRLPEMQNFQFTKSVCLSKIRSVVLGSAVDTDVAEGSFRIWTYDERAY